jgi:hypothetical protein
LAARQVKQTMPANNRVFTVRIWGALETKSQKSAKRSRWWGLSQSQVIVAKSQYHLSTLAVALPETTRRTIDHG